MTSPKMQPAPQPASSHSSYGTSYRTEPSAEYQARLELERREAAFEEQQRRLEQQRLEQQRAEQRYRAEIERRQTAVVETRDSFVRFATEFWGQNPRNLPANEVALAFEHFHAGLKQTEDEARALAIETIRKEFVPEADRVREVPLYARLQTKLMSTLTGPPAGKLLKGTKVSRWPAVPPSMTTQMLARIGAASRFRAEQWCQRSSSASQVVVTVFRDEANARTMVYVTGPTESYFIEIPALLDPAQAAEQALQQLRRVVGPLTRNGEPVLILNGDHRAANLKPMLPGRIVLRSASGDTAGLAERISRVCERGALEPHTTTIISGLPETADEARAVLGSAENWDVWADVSPSWARTVAQRGFTLARQNTAPREAFLSALQESRDVIVLVAHADRQELRFPKPPPDGSKVTAEDIARIKDGITRNQPVVYLFCCETASVEDLEPMAQTLLQAGAAAVVAPQRSIEAHGSRRLFDQFLRRARTEAPLAALREAESRTRNRDQEVWI